MSRKLEEKSGLNAGRSEPGPSVSNEGGFDEDPSNDMEESSPTPRSFFSSSRLPTLVVYTVVQDEAMMRSN